jgi:hypothetical protein
LYLKARELGPFYFVPEPLAREHFVLTARKEQLWLEAAATFDRMALERFGIHPLNEFSSLIHIALVHMARGEPAVARKLFLRALRLRPLEMKTYMRLIWACLPVGLSRAVGEAMPLSLRRKLNGPPRGVFQGIAV